MTAKMSREDSRIRDVVRNSKILWDVLSKIDQKLDVSVVELHREIYGLKHEVEDSSRRQKERVFPRLAVGEHDSYEQEYRKHAGIPSSFDEIERWFHHYMGKEASFHGFYNGHGASDSLIVRFKRNLPSFDGFWHIEDLLSWIDAIEDFFEETRPPEHLKCKIIWYKMKGAAYYWWKILQNDRLSEGKNLVISWPKMRELLISRFAPSKCSTKGMLEVHNNNNHEENEGSKMVGDLCHTAKISRTEVSNEDNEYSEEKSEGAEAIKHTEQEGADRIEYIHVDNSKHAKCSIKAPTDRQDGVSDSEFLYAAGDDSFKRTNELQHLDSNSMAPESCLPNSVDDFEAESVTAYRNIGAEYEDANTIKTLITSSQVVPINPFILELINPNSLFTSLINKGSLECGTEFDNANGEQPRRRILLEIQDIDFVVGKILMLNFDPGGAKTNDPSGELRQALLAKNERIEYNADSVKRQAEDLKGKGSATKPIVQMQSKELMSTTGLVEIVMPLQDLVSYKLDDQYKVRRSNMAIGFGVVMSPFPGGNISLTNLIFIECMCFSYFAAEILSFLIDPGGDPCIARFGKFENYPFLSYNILWDRISLRNIVATEAASIWSSNAIKGNGDRSFHMMIKDLATERKLLYLYMRLGNPVDNLIRFMWGYAYTNVVVETSRGYVCAVKVVNKYRGAVKFNPTIGHQLRPSPTTQAYTMYFAVALMTEGWANEGLHPFCAVYASFLQTTYGQEMCDSTLWELFTRFAMDRVGFFGVESFVHWNVSDVMSMECLLNTVAMAPPDETNLGLMVVFVNDIRNEGRMYCGFSEKQVYVGMFLHQLAKNRMDESQKLTNVYVKNLLVTTIHDDLHRILRNYGSITNAVVIKYANGTFGCFDLDAASVQTVRLSCGIFVSWCDLPTDTGLDLARGRAVPREGWKDENINMEMKFIMAKIRVVTISSRLNILFKNGQFMETLKLLHKVVNGLDPPMDLDSACSWIFMSSLVDELLRRRDGDDVAHPS